MQDYLVPFPKQLPWCKPGQVLSGNPKFLKRLVSHTNPSKNFSKIVITIFARSKYLNDYPTIDVSSINEPPKNILLFQGKVQMLKEHFRITVPKR
jgi:hypothetical protein